MLLRVKQDSQALKDAACAVTTLQRMAAFYTANQACLHGYEAGGSDSGYKTYLHQQEGTSYNVLDSRKGASEIASLRKQMQGYEKRVLDSEQNLPESQRRLENMIVSQIRLSSTPAASTYLPVTKTNPPSGSSSSAASGQARPSQSAAAVAAAPCTTLQVITSLTRRAIIDQHLFGMMNGAAMTLADLHALQELKNIHIIVHSPNYDPDKKSMLALSPAVEGDDTPPLHIARVSGAYMAEQAAQIRFPNSISNSSGSNLQLGATCMLDTMMAFIDPTTA